MPENEIIAEIHRHRAELARRFDFDIHKLTAFYREREASHEASGKTLVSLAQPLLDPASPVVREDSAGT